MVNGIDKELTNTGMKDRALQQFDKWAHSYDRSLLHHFLFRPSYLTLMEEVALWYREHQRSFNLLDIGCGTGEFASMLAHSDWPVSVVGLDYAPAMCSKAAQKAGRASVSEKPSFAAGDSEFLPFASRSFDIVTCSNSFHHYPDQAAVVSRIFDLLRRQGRFILIDGFRDCVVGWVTFDIVIHKVEGGVCHASWTTIDKYFQNAGFAKVRRRKKGLWTPICATIGNKEN